jgi:hypothetical protein
MASALNIIHNKKKFYFTLFFYFYQNRSQDWFQPTISLEMPVPSQGHYGFHSFPVVD